MTDTERKALVEGLRRPYPECAGGYADDAADQIEADGQRIAELSGINGELLRVMQRLREALIHTAGICNPASGFLKNTTGLRKKHVENAQAIALAALGDTPCL